MQVRPGIAIIIMSTVIIMHCSGIIPGPHEPSQNINTFLQLLVDDLLVLWNGIVLDSDRSVTLRAAVVTVSADLPALRKITQFLGHKADFGCSRCKFQAEREPGTRGASGKMSYYTPRHSTERSHHEVLQQAREYQDAVCKSDAAAIAQRNGVRYSELLRLPYFDIVRMSATDPMHSFLLGLVKRETELNLQLLTPSQIQEFTRRVKGVRIPYDVGRLPTNIFDSESVSGVTAEQWKTYITTYARPCMYKLLPHRPYKSLVLLAEIVSIVVSPVLSSEMVELLYRLLQEHHQTFCQFYGKWNVTVNYHMCLHLPDIIADLGPPHSFWCFAYERLNGMLAGVPNSNRVIEVEVANRFIRDTSFSISDTQLDVNISRIPPALTEFVQTADDPHPPYPLTFWVLRLLSCAPEERFKIQMEIDRGDVVNWLLELNTPKKLNVQVKPPFSYELHTFFTGLYGSRLEYIKPRVNKYGRCAVNGMKFSSDFNSTDRGSIVKAMFVDTDNSLAPYFGVVKFYFTATVVVQQKPITHELAYVKWLKFRYSKPDPLSKLYELTTDTYVQDRILSPRRFLCRCVLVSTRRDSSFFLVSEVSR